MQTAICPECGQENCEHFIGVIRSNENRYFYAPYSNLSFVITGWEYFYKVSNDYLATLSPICKCDYCRHCRGEL